MNSKKKGTEVKFPVCLLWQWVVYQWGARMDVLEQGDVWSGAEQPSWCAFGRDGVGALMPRNSPIPGAAA